ncbi:LamG-like jellyroll fold domain-containing protein [Natronoflexus pectinivorans]|nr:LamG-like jellyroll fold domain-containing protein [Natronoflexus pectinivorans]
MNYWKINSIGHSSLQFVLMIFFLFLFVYHSDAQRRRAASNAFVDQFFLVSNYSDLNNHLEPETMTIRELLQANVRGFQIRLEVDADSAIIRMITPQKNEKPFSYFLDEISIFLNQNPGEVLTLFLDYNFPFFYLETALKAHHLYNKIFVSETDDLWPSTKMMAERGYQLVCFTLQRNQDTPPGFYHLWDYAVEPHFSTVLEPEFHGSFARGRASNPFMFFTGYNLPRDTTGIEIPFLMMNINENPFLISHLINLWKKTGKRPNFIVRNRYHYVILGVIENLNSHNTISGNITYNLHPLSDVSWEGSTQALTSGHYSFPFLAGEDVFLQPFKPGYSFTPERVNLSNVREDITQNFLASPLDLHHRLKAYFPFESSTRDASANRNHGKNHGVRFAEDPIRGSVAYLTDDTFIELPDAETLGLHNNDFTVSAWLRISPLQEERRDITILGTEEATYRQGLHLQLRNARPYFGFFANDITGNTEIRPNEWVHVVWRYTKRTGEQAIFVNGRPDGISQKHPSFMGRGTVNIGRAIQMYNYMNGYIDDLAIWDRPLGNEEIWKLYQDVVPLYQSKKTNWNLIVFLTAGILLVVYLIILLYTRKNRQKSSVKTEAQDVPVINMPTSEKFRPNSICLFGEFQVIDREGNDISLQFTPKIRQLLVLLLLYSQKPRRGISSDDINQILWYGLSRKNATNNRGVNMSKLRQVLTFLDGIRIDSQMENWMININREQLFCDYVEVQAMLRNRSMIDNPEGFVEFFSTVETGALLIDMEEEWLDEFKGHTASEIVDTLLKSAQQPFLTGNHDMIIKICDRVFIGDPYSEEALKLKINALIKQRHFNQAKYTYQWFSDNYEKSLGEPFSLAFESFVEK